LCVKYGQFFPVINGLIRNAIITWRGFFERLRVYSVGTI